jgi:hypothetical protein
MEMSLEEQLAYHAHMLAVIGKKLGYNKVTDKTKWREPIMAGKLGHKAFDKISAGKNSDKYGADALIESTGTMAEYKSSALEEKQLRNLLQKKRNEKTGTTFSPLKISGVYNGAYTHEAIDAYEKHGHYFGVFYEERCLLIIQPHTDVVIGQLRAEVNRRAGLKNKGSTNLNTVHISLGDTHLYTVAYRDEEWFKENE